MTDINAAFKEIFRTRERAVCIFMSSIEVDDMVARPGISYAHILALNFFDCCVMCNVMHM